MRIFVTGGTGFFGAHLVHGLLRAQHTVTVLTRDPDRAVFGRGVGVFGGDLAELARGGLPALGATLAGHDALIHNALVWGEPSTDLELLDVRASARLFSLAAEVGVAHTIYTSSVAVHRPFAPQMAVAQAAVGADLYGATKLAGEALLSAFAGSMRTHVLRPGPIVDAPVPGHPFRLDRRLGGLIEAARRDEVLTVSAGEGRQLIGADALADLYVALLGQPPAEGRLIAVAPRLITWLEIARKIIGLLGRGRIEVVEDPASPALFDVGLTEAVLGPIADPGAALERALRFAVGGR